MTEQTTPTAAEREERSARLTAFIEGTAAAGFRWVPLPDLLTALKELEHEGNTNADVPYGIEVAIAARDELTRRPVESIADALVVLNYVNHEREENSYDASGCLGKVAAFLEQLAATQAPQAAA